MGGFFIKQGQYKCQGSTIYNVTFSVNRHGGGAQGPALHVVV